MPNQYYEPTVEDMLEETMHRLTTDVIQFEGGLSLFLFNNPDVRESFQYSVAKILRNSRRD